MAKKSETATPKVKKLNRADAVNTVIAHLDSKSSLGELATKIDAMVVEHGGKSNVRAAIHVCRRALETVEALGIVKLTRPTDLLVERVKK